ncbi:MAG: RluA family pseudouridine synthase [Clostridiales bacterium]|jgi:23S rRNA pseudouridine955/2504/2580 synthase|nr:RluA family pseudouridine synthase [Clostridiales bacterium]
MREIKINAEVSGGRLDKFLLKYMPKAGKAFVYKMLRKKNITLNGAKACGNEILKDRDILRLYLAEETIEKFRSSEKNVPDAPAAGTGRLDIVYEDENILILNKPPGLLSQPAAGFGKKADSLIGRVKAYLLNENEMSKQNVALNKDGISKQNIAQNKNDMSKQNVAHDENPLASTCAIANRLDRNTSGLVLCGKNLVAVRELNNALAEGKIKKIYHAAVYGTMREEVTLRDYFVKDGESNTGFIKNPDELQKSALPSESGLNQKSALSHEPGLNQESALPQNPTFSQKHALNQNFREKEIITRFKPLHSKDGFSLIEAELITGRSHQIRLHLQSAGYPVLGDKKYGNAAANAKAEDYFGAALQSQLLHAFKLSFATDGKLAYLNGKEFTAKPPFIFSNVADKIK